jgi:hypothetical protein
MSKRQVYNKYQQSDFEVGQDNLNPVHKDSVNEERSEEYREKLARSLQERLRDRDDLKVNIKKR